MKFITPRDEKLVELYRYNVFITHPWSGNDVNVIDPDLRERIKTYRSKGLSYDEIGVALRCSTDTVYSVLTHEI